MNFLAENTAIHKSPDYDRNKLIWLFLAIAAAQIVLYLPALTLPFAGFEDFQFLEKGWSGFMKNPNIPIQIDVGRPLGALILGMYAGIISSISDLNIVRSVSVAVLSICQMSLVIFLLRTGMGSLLAFGMSTTIFATATISSIGQWAAAAQMPFAILFAFLAAEFLYKGMRVKQSTEKASIFSCFKERWVLFSCFTLIISFLIYPTLALFFVVPFFGLTLFCEKKLFDAHHKRILTVAVISISFVYALYFFGIKFIYFPIIRDIYPELFGNPIYSFDITSSIFSKVIWMLTEVIPRFTEVFAVSNGGRLWISGILLLGGSAFVARLFYRENILRDRRGFKIILIRLFLLICFFGIGNAHLVLSESAHLAPRVYAVGQTMLILVLFAAIIELVSLVNTLQRNGVAVGIVLTIAMAAVVFSNKSIHTTALNQWMELRYLGAEIKRQYTSTVSTIAVVQVPRRSMFIGEDIPGYNWTNSDVIGSMIPAMAAQALINIGITDRYVDGLGANTAHENAGRKGLKVIPIKPDDRAYIEVDSAEIEKLEAVKVIDMRQLLMMSSSNVSEEPRSLEESVEVVLMLSSSVQKSGDRYGPGSALRPDLNNPDRFWEAGPMPVSLQFFFEDKKDVRSYTLGTGVSATGRMPIAWRVEGLGEANTWEVLDSQENQEWIDSEIKTFLIKRVGSYQRYRIVFEKSLEGILRVYDLKLHYDR
jgi:hypothetical protein